MILGGAGGAPPPGDGQVSSDPDYCTVEEWFRNTVTVINPEGKDPQSPQGHNGEIEEGKKFKRTVYTPEEIEKIIAQFEYEHERDTARHLLEHGEEVQKNPNEGQPGQGDALVNGENTEFKAIFGVVDTSEDGLSDAISCRIMDGRGQALNIVVNVSKQQGMTQAAAERGITRAYGADNKAGMKIQSIRVIGNSFDIKVPRK